MTRLDAITNESLRISKSGMVQITNTASSCYPFGNEQQFQWNGAGVHELDLGH